MYFSILLTLLINCSAITPNKKRYLISFKQSTEHQLLESEHKLQLFGEYLNKEVFYEKPLSIINGCSAFLTKKGYGLIKRMEQVKSIEEDRSVAPFFHQHNTTWNLARVSSKTKLKPNSSFNYNYSNLDRLGEGVNVYLLDTGINVDHEDLEERAIMSANYTPDSDKDNSGHGTHCAGIIAGKKYGISKKAIVIGVKIFADDGSSTFYSIIQSLQHVVNHVKKKGGKKGNVINMSLGSKYSEMINDAVDNVISKGILVIAAAGNNKDDACFYSPGSSENVLTVAASTANDNKASFSNYGECVSLFAPGEDIESIWIDSNASTKLKSGTSMSAPHVTGLAANILSNLEKTPTANELYRIIEKNSIEGVLVGDIGEGSPNKLVYTNFQFTKNQ